MGWRESLQTTGLHLAPTDEDRQAFWKESLGELLLDEQEANFKQDEEEANKLAAPLSKQYGTLATAPDVEKRDKALATLNQQKMEVATFNKNAREKALDDFEAALKALTIKNDDTIAALQKEYTDKYNQARYDEAIRKEKLKYTDNSNDQTLYKRVFTRMQKKNEHAVITDTDIINKQEEKINTMTNTWRAMWFGLKNSKYFSLSCGTTMGGALIMIAAKTGSPIFLAITAVAALPILYIVTRANWWLTNKAIPDLMEELSDPVKLVSNFFKKLQKRPFATPFIFTVTTTVSLIWAAFTYDTTLELGNQLFDEPAKYGITMMGDIFAYAAIVGGAISVLYQLRGIKIRSLISSTPWLSLSALLVGVLGLVIGADSIVFRKIAILSVTIFMTVFTAPTIYAVFGLYTERAVKALSGATDEEGRDNEFHHKHIDASFAAITQSAIDAGSKEVARFKNTYRFMLVLGAFVAICATFFLRNALMDGFTPDALRFSIDSWKISQESVISFVIAATMVGGIVKSLFTYIDYKNPAEPGAAAPINKNMIYKSTAIMGFAALVGAFAIDIASEHIMANVFTKWFGATQTEAMVCNYIFTVALGIMGAAPFYVGSAKKAIERFFQPTPLPKERDFSDIIYENKGILGQIWHRFKDTADLFGTEPSRGTFDKTVAANSVFNALPALFSGMASMIKGFFFFLSAGAASAAGNYGAGNPKPRELPNIERAQQNIDMMHRVVRFSSVQKENNTRSSPSPSFAR